MLTLTVFQHADLRGRAAALRPCAARTRTTRSSSTWRCTWARAGCSDAALLKLNKRSFRLKGVQVLRLTDWHGLTEARAELSI
jgi:hypothetical protein